jgi:leucyl aminopeptidase
VELLPAERDVRVVTRRSTLDERSFSSHDAVIVVADKGAMPATLRRLPFGAQLERHHEREARSRSTVSLLSTHVGSTSAAYVVAFAHALPTFDQLSLGASIWKKLVSEAPRRVLICTWEVPAAQQAALLQSVLAAVLAGSAWLPTLKSKRTPRAKLETITIYADAGRIDIERAIAVDRGNHLARWLTALPPNLLDSGSYRRVLNRLARQERWGFTFFNLRALERQRAGAFLAVARANDHADAGIVRLVRRARDRSQVRARIALVGKGVCFDTGGINLKPHKYMYPMHEDMQGSAVALGTLLALSRLEAPIDIDCWLAITENNIGPRAYRPQEVVTAANGVTIQVVHSDAEGRMALADTLALAARAKPDLLLDFATLTGACVTALTERFSGVFTNRSDWHATLQRAGRESGERVWPFPMDEDFDADLESPIADVLQCTLEGKGDHILAARFLNRFVPADIPWVHVDLASSNRTGGLAHIPTDYTGFGVRYATHLLLDHNLLGKPARRTTQRSAAR